MWKKATLVPTQVEWWLSGIADEDRLLIVKREKHYVLPGKDAIGDMRRLVLDKM